MRSQDIHTDPRYEWEGLNHQKLQDPFSIKNNMGEIEGKEKALVITLNTGPPDLLSGTHWKAQWAFLRTARENGRGF